MKNNTAYLKTIHWVTLLAAAYGLTVIYLAPWLYELIDHRNTASIILSIFITGFTYSAIGLATSSLKEMFIPAILNIGLFILYLYIPVSDTGWKQTIYLFTTPIPLSIFICRILGPDKKVFVVYLGVFVATLVLMMTSFEAGPIFRLTSVFRGRHEIWQDLLKLFFYIATKVFFVIIVCEMVNYMRSDTKKPRPMLLNLGNEYDRLNSFIAFWVMKTSLLLIALGTANYLKLLGQSLSPRSFRFDITPTDDGLRYYVIIIGITSLVGAVLLAVFAAWYLRRLLLEYFITYDVRSKFLYWLAIVPFIGFLSFLFMETNEGRKRDYTGKIDSMGNFAGSSTTAISIITFMLLFIRMLVRLSNTEPAVVISVVLASLLFTWMIYSRVAYYLNATVILLALLAIIVYTLMASHVIEEMITYFALLILGLAQLILVLPIYHFDKFLYTPAENPEPVPDQPRDIFA